MIGRLIQQQHLGLSVRDHGKYDTTLKLCKIQQVINDINSRTNLLTSRECVDCTKCNITRQSKSNNNYLIIFQVNSLKINHKPSKMSTSNLLICSRVFVNEKFKRRHSQIELVNKMLRETCKLQFTVSESLYNDNKSVIIERNI